MEEPTPIGSAILGVALLFITDGQLATLSAAETGTRVFHVRDFGAVADGRTESGAAIRAAISEAIVAGNRSERPVEIVLEAGTYLVRPERPRTDCFLIRQATNLVVRGAGQATRIVINDPASAGFSFGLSRNVSIRDLSVDYDPAPFCQGTIRAVDVDAGWFELDVEPGYPTPDAGNFIQAIEPYGKWGMILDRKTRRIRSGTPDHFMTPRWEHRGNRVWRFFTADEHHRRNLIHMRVGDAYVHLARGHGSAVFAQGCDGIRIEGVAVHAAPGLAVGLVGNRGEIVVRRLEVRFASDTTRLLTTNADGVHCQQNRAGPVIEDCTFEGMADDAINIYAPPNVLREVRSPTQWLVSSGTLILAGDRLQVLDPRTGALRGEVKAVEVTAESRAWLLTLEAPLAGAVVGADHRSADTLYNLDACGAGFQIRRNQMNGHRRYGCLLRAGDGVVEDNTFADTTGAGVVLTNEPDWPEGPVPWEITIRRNRFIRGGTCLGYADSPQGAALAVRATRLGHGLAEAEAIRNVIVEDNTFVDRAGAAVFVGGASKVTLRGTRITAEPDAELRRRGPAILIERSSGIALTDNAVSDPRPGTTAAIEVGRGVPAGPAGVSISDLKATLAPGAKPVLGIEDAAASATPHSPGSGFALGRFPPVSRGTRRQNRCHEIAPHEPRISRRSFDRGLRGWARIRVLVSSVVHRKPAGLGVRGEAPLSLPPHPGKDAAAVLAGRVRPLRRFVAAVNGFVRGPTQARLRCFRSSRPDAAWCIPAQRASRLGHTPQSPGAPRSGVNDRNRPLSGAGRNGSNFPSPNPWDYAPSVRTLAEDTSPEAQRVLIELWREATPARKFALVLDTTRSVQEFMLSGLRERHPDESPARVRRRFAELWLGPELARRVYGDATDDSHGS